MNKIGLLVIATGKYVEFLPALYESILKYFLPKHEVKMIVFTDRLGSVPEGAIPCYFHHFPWPAPSLLRYKMFNRYRETLREFDYLYYCDADSLFVGPVGEEVLTEMVAVEHFEYIGRNPREFPLERNRQSTACVGDGDVSHLVCGSFWGGKTKKFLEMVAALEKDVDADLAKGLMAVSNYDMAYLNKYVGAHPKTKILNPEYCYPGNRTLPAFHKNRKIIALVKDHVAVRDTGGDNPVTKEQTEDFIRVISYANAKYRPYQAMLCRNLFDIGFRNIVAYTEEWLRTTEFYRDNQDALDLPRGAGYWLWKPYIILKTLEGMKDGEMMLYVDAGDSPAYGFKEMVKERLADKGFFLVQNSTPMSTWTKRDSFVLCDAEADKYYKGNQLEAGIIGLVKTEANVRMVQEWLFLCQNKHILTDIPNICGKPNFPGFQEHRHDQAVLSILAIKYDMKGVPLGAVGRCVKYNVNNDPLPAAFGKTVVPGIKPPKVAEVTEEITEPEEVKETLLEKYHLPPDFGPDHPKFNVPSFRNRYNQMKEEG